MSTFESYLKETDYQQVLELQFDVTKKFTQIFFHRMANLQAETSKLSARDLQLSYFIISSFSELFRIWSTSPSLKNALKRELFYDVHSQMFNAFNYQPGETGNTENPNQGILVECDLCDEPFTVTGNDLQSSYTVHSSSPKHTKMVKVFEEIGLDTDKKEPVASVPSAGTPDTNRNANSRKPPKQTAKKEKSPTVHDKSVYCDLCNVLFPAPNEMVSHVAGKWHNFVKAEFFEKNNVDVKLLKLVSETDCSVECGLCNTVTVGLLESTAHCSSFQHVDYKCIVFRNTLQILRNSTNLDKVVKNIYINVNENLYCMLCCQMFEAGNKCVHANSDNHKKLKNRLTELLSNEMLLSVVQDKGIQCNLCIEICALLKDAEEHCNSERHKKRRQYFKDYMDIFSNQLQTTDGGGVTKNASENFVVYDNGIPFCVLCSCKLQNSNNIDNHINGSTHKCMKNNFNTIMSHGPMKKLFS